MQDGSRERQAEMLANARRHEGSISVTQAQRCRCVSRCEGSAHHEGLSNAGFASRTEASRKSREAVQDESCEGKRRCLRERPKA